MFTVLIAERSCAHLSDTYQILQTHFRDDCIFYTANSKQEIHRFLDQTPTDILLVDMQMSGIHHRDLTGFLQRQPHPRLILPMEPLESFDPVQYPDHAAIPEYILTPASESELVLTLETVLQMCGNSRFRQGESAGSGDISRNDIIKNKIQHYIANHYHEIISMQDVANAMNYSETHFCRLFKQYFHVNFSVYLNELRIFHAKHLLTNSNHTIKDIGFLCGYRDTSYFIRVFKRITGTTPSDYRIYELTRTAKKSNES